MTNSTTAQSGGLNINTLHETAMNVVENVCGAFSRPVDMIVRPWHGTRYFPVPVIFVSTVGMVILPVFATVATIGIQMIPFTHFQMPMALFNIASLAKLYFLLSAIHGVRLYRRMIDMTKENISTFEGAALPFFAMLPKGNSFWVTRIIWEPLFVLCSALVLDHLYIITPGLSLYLQLAAISLAMKNFVVWFRAWSYIRDLMDMGFLGPVIAKLAKNQASDEELGKAHLASFPKDAPLDFRKAALSHIARTFSADTEPEEAQL